jgi:hypothetical protein
VELDGNEATVTKLGSQAGSGGGVWSTLDIGDRFLMSMSRTGDNTWSGSVKSAQHGYFVYGDVRLDGSTLTVNAKELKNGTEYTGNYEAPYTLTRVSGGSGTGSGSGNGSGSGSGGGSGSGSSSIPGYGGSISASGWKRNDGLGGTLVYLSGSVAKTCANGVETIGTFSNSKPYSMTFVIQGNSIKFPLDFSTDGSKMIVGVPDQALATHNASEYIKSAYSCGGSGGGSGGGTQQKGEAMFWTKLNSTGYSYNVTVKNGSYNFTSYITARHNSEPACGASGATTQQLNPGTYTYEVKGKRWQASGTPIDYTWGGSITVSSNNCTKVELK